MNHDYADIRDKIAEAPQWWDENAVPRVTSVVRQRVQLATLDGAIIL